jgi:hypothetical protein
MEIGDFQQTVDMKKPEKPKNSPPAENDFERIVQRLLKTPHKPHKKAGQEKKGKPRAPTSTEN